MTTEFNYEQLSSKPLNELTTAERKFCLAKATEEENKKKQKDREDYEALREDLVNTIVDGALVGRERLTNWKTKVTNDLKVFRGLMKEHSKRHGEDVLSYTIYNAAQTKKIVVGYDELGRFDERSKEAVKLIMLFVNRQFPIDNDVPENNARRNLILRLMKFHKNQLDVKRVQDIYSLEIEFNDPDLSAGIEMLKQSWMVTETKEYTNFYEKTHSGWKLISLSFPALDVLA